MQASKTIFAWTVMTRLRWSTCTVNFRVKRTKKLSGLSGKPVHSVKIFLHTYINEEKTPADSRSSGNTAATMTPFEPNKIL